MSEKIFVAYCTSGLGNRLRPLAAAIAYCKLTGRKLRVYWDSITPNGCLTPLERLYQNSFEAISLSEIEALGAGSLSLYTEKGPGHGVRREAEKFGRNQLLNLSRYSDPKHAGAVTLDDPADAIIVYDNDYLPCVPRELSIQALRSLRPSEDIRAKVLRQAAEFGLTLQTKGVHARGTDFGLKDALAMYSQVIRERVAIDQGEKFFLSTEDKLLEAGLRELFPAHILSRDDRLHLELNAGKTGWHDPDSYTISADHGVDALTDVYMLSCVNLVVFHPGSTFAEISRHLHGVLQEAEPAPLTGPATSALDRARAEFIQRASQLMPRGSAPFPLEVDCGAAGPLPTEALPPSFWYWETLGYQTPLMERLFMGSNSTPHLSWDADIFSILAKYSFDNLPMDLFRRLCPYPEAFSQMRTMRGYLSGKKILIIGSESYWLELLCAIGGAAEVTTVEYREIQWSGKLDCPTRLKTMTWDHYVQELDAHKGQYDLILTYSSIEHSGLGRYGDRLSPLGDLFAFLLMSQAMKPSGVCAVAVPTGQDLTHFNAHRIYGTRRIQALAHISQLNYLGIAFPDAEYLQTDPAEHLRQGWHLPELAKLPLGSYRQPILCFARPDFSQAAYLQAS